MMIGGGRVSTSFKQLSHLHTRHEHTFKLKYLSYYYYTADAAAGLAWFNRVMLRESVSQYVKPVLSEPVEHCERSLFHDSVCSVFVHVRVYAPAIPMGFYGT